MAKYTKVYTTDGKEHHELEFRGKVFSFTLFPVDSCRKESDKCNLDNQVEEEFDDVSEDVLQAIDDLWTASDSEVCDLLEIISEEE